EAGQQRSGVLACLPDRQHERLETILQLVVGAYRQVCLTGADSHERDAQLVAKESQEVQELSTDVTTSSKHIVQLIDHQHLHTDLAQQGECEALELDHTRARP